MCKTYVNLLLNFKTNVTHVLKSITAKYFVTLWFKRFYLISKLVLFNRNEFRITDTELKLIAAAAIIGLIKIPKIG